MRTTSMGVLSNWDCNLREHPCLKQYLLFSHEDKFSFILMWEKEIMWLTHEFSFLIDISNGLNGILEILELLLFFLDFLFHLSKNLLVPISELFLYIISHMRINSLLTIGKFWELNCFNKLCMSWNFVNLKPKVKNTHGWIEEMMKLLLWKDWIDLLPM